MKFFKYHNTNCFFIGNGKGGYLAFDAGWPCTLFEYKRMLKGIGVNYKDIRWGIISHMHMDHAGLLSEFQSAGIECLLTAEQFLGIDAMEKIILKNSEYEKYVRIDKKGIRIIETKEINVVLRNNGLKAEIVETDGHSKDSITLITDDHKAIIGDLSPPNQIMEDDIKSLESWNKIRSRDVRFVYPSHAEPFEIEENG